MSAFPVVHDRYNRRGAALADVARWCQHAGVPAPIAAVLDRLPLVEGAVRLQPNEAARDGRTRMPYTHLKVSFATPIRGPLVLGHLRTFGLGLMLPMKRSNDA